MADPQRVCLLGAESTGKTTLAQALAAHFGGLWAPEVLREFCAQHQRTPRREEQAAIAQAQVAQESALVHEAAARGLRWVFCDTSPLLTAVYSEFYFSDHALYALAQAHQPVYALTLWLMPDLPWRADGLQRDGRPVQAAVQAVLAQHLSAQPRVRQVLGAGTERLACAVRAVQTCCAELRVPD